MEQPRSESRESAGFMEEFATVSTASFILRNGFERVALQFPDEMLKNSVAVVSALKKEISKQQQQSESRAQQQQHINGSIRLFMADTTYRSCCADEAAAAHIDGQCIVHYGHTCLSVPSRFVFGRGAHNAESCATSIVEFAAGKEQPVFVMCGLEDVYALHNIQEQVLLKQVEEFDVVFVDAPSQLMEPYSSDKTHDKQFVGRTSERRC